MGWLRTLLTWDKAPKPGDDPAVIDSVEFSHSTETEPRPIDAVIRDMLGGTTPRAGRAEALTVPAVLRGRNLICSISTLPLRTRNRDLVTVRTPFLEQIDENVPNVVTMSQTLEDLIFESIAWWRITARFADGFPASAMYVNATSVSLVPPSGTQPQTLPSGLPPKGTVWIDGKPVPATDMIRFDSPNPALLKAAGRSIRRAILLEETAMMYARDPRALEFFTPTDGADPVDDDDVREILDEWEDSRRRNAAGYVPAALKHNTVDAISPADLQLAELQKQVTIDIANALGLDSEDLQVSTTSRTYANATDRRRDRINDTLSPYMQAITDRLSMNDVTKRGNKVSFELDEYMRADPATRWNTYEVGLRNKIVSVEEVRETEGLSVIPVERSTQIAARESAPVAKFSDDSAYVSFEVDEPELQFRVNREKRTISGMLVPWDKVGTSMGVKWEFGEDSLEWVDEARVKLNRDHDKKQAVGVAIRLQSTPKGLDGSFRIARGEEGDRVLSLAEDGVLDGFSVEVPIDDVEFSWVRASENDPIRKVTRGKLAGVAITSRPAFDDARVSSIAATRDGDNPMPEEVLETSGATAQEPNNETLATFTSAVEALTSAVNQFSERPVAVDQTRQTASTSVNEGPIYRFDGIGNDYDFSSDLISGSKGDGEALQRVERFMEAQFVDSTDTGALNPDRQRPDLYVDQLDFVLPIYNSIRKGSIPDNTPFVLPKFASSSGLVSDHSEGVEPTNGAFSATSQTITPSPVSGKVEVTSVACR